MTETTATDASATSFGRGGRMSRQRKRDAVRPKVGQTDVLRLLRGEDLELVSRALGASRARRDGPRR